MESQERTQIDRLVSELADNAATPERVAELEAILKDRGDLQEYYCRVVGVDFLLRHEMQLSGVSAALSPTEPAPLLPPDSLASPEDNRPSAPSSQGVRGKREAWLAGAAVVTGLATALALAVWMGAASDANHSPEPSDVASLINPAHGMLIRDSEVLGRLERINRTNPLASLTLPVGTSNASPRVSLCSGAAWMDYTPNDRERGYLLALPPSVRVDVTIDANAICHNSVSVVELGNAGEMTGRTLSFTNHFEGVAGSREDHADSIGQFSEYNDSDETRFYLITGTHKLVEDRDDAPWRASDFRVHFATDDFLVIGWDDCGYAEGGPGLPSGDDADGDYDDVRALFRFTKPGDTPARSGLAFEPAGNVPDTLATLTGDEFQFDVRPGEETLLMLSSDASRSNELLVVDTESSRVVWHHDSGDPKFVSPSQQTVYLIRNHEPLVKRFSLVGRHKAHVDGEWLSSPHKVVVDKGRLTAVGFEDCVDFEKNLDWNDLRVDIHRFAYKE